MSDTASNTTNYRYDARGQLAVQQNVINGSGTFKTLYGYNSAGMLATMTYPGNNTGGTDETVSYTYLPQGAPDALTYDAENRLVIVKQDGTTIATFVYDGDGNRIKSVVNGVTTALVGTHFEWTGSTSTMVKYYYAGAQRLAMRTGNGTANSSVKWLLGDHLGSTSLTTNYDGASPVTQLYKPWGESRYSSGSLPTKYTYTGQYSSMSDFGLMFYNARWYDPALGRFVSADSWIPRGMSEEMFLPLVTGYYSESTLLTFIQIS
jgi:RHS repeat-associated protein